MLKEKIGQRIKEIRMFNLKVSQDELATKIGWDRTFLSKVESGKQNITIENLNLACNALDITLADSFSVFCTQILENGDDGNERAQSN